jgi:hypothetical protein
MLADSIRQHHPQAHVTILTQDQLPFGNQGAGYVNDWQCFWASPYRQTIKLEADMIAATGIDHWWTLFEHRDVVISLGARTYRDQPADSRFYRHVFDANNLPDVYNAITYWRVSPVAQEFFTWVKDIFVDWEYFRTLLKFSEDRPTTDVVYAMAAQIMGPERVTLPPGLGPNIVHMKRHINGLIGEDWTQELIWEIDPLRINTIAQWGLVHYHVKDWRPV